MNRYLLSILKLVLKMNFSSHLWFAWRACLWDVNIEPNQNYSPDNFLESARPLKIYCLKIHFLTRSHVSKSWKKILEGSLFILHLFLMIYSIKCTEPSTGYLPTYITRLSNLKHKSCLTLHILVGTYTHSVNSAIINYIECIN